MLKNLKLRILSTKFEIQSAKHLLYCVYVEELGWKPSKNNKSGICVKKNKGHKILCDNIDERAIWLGIFFKNQIVACMRYCGVDINGLLEMQHYMPLNVNVKFCSTINTSHNKTIEIGRYAAHKDFRGKGILLYMMFKFVCDLCLLQQLSICATIPKAYFGVSKIAKNSQFLQIENLNFKYEINDPSDVSVYFVDYFEQSVLQMRNSCEKMIEKNTQSKL